MTKRTAKPPTTTTLPAIQLDDHVVETIAHWFDLWIAQAGAGNSHRILSGFIRKLVREGKMPLRRVIELTRDPDAAIDADEALRGMAEEINERGERLPQLLTNYLICFPRPSRGRGRLSGDNWLRDQCLACCIAFALGRWGAFYLLYRNPATDSPSICSLVSRAAESRGIKKMSEKRVEQIWRRFAEFFPEHQDWLMLEKLNPI